MIALAFALCSLLDLGGASCTAYPDVLALPDNDQWACAHYDVVLAVNDSRMPIVERACQPDEVRDALSGMEGTEP